MPDLTERFVTEINRQWPEQFPLPQQIQVTLGFGYEMTASIEARVPVALVPIHLVESQQALVSEIGAWVTELENWRQTQQAPSKGWAECRIQLYSAQQGDDSPNLTSEFTVLVELNHE